MRSSLQRCLGLVAISLIILSPGCSPGEPDRGMAGGQTTPVEAETESIREAARLWVGAMNRRDFDAISDLYSSEVVFLAPGQHEIDSVEGIGEYLRRTWESEKFSYTYRSQEVRFLGDVALERGFYVLASGGGDEGTARSESGNVLRLWETQPDGSHRIWREIWNVSLATGR